MTIEDMINTIMSEGVPDMDETDYVVLFDPTKDKDAEVFTEGHAIDIKYECPKCKSERASTWLFPDSDMYFDDECCDVTVLFKAREEDDS